MLLKCAANSDCFSKRNQWSGSCNSKTLASGLPLENHLTSVNNRRCVCSPSISSQNCMNRCELRVCTLRWLIILIISCKTLLSSGDIYSLASISQWMTQCIDTHSAATSLTPVVKSDSCPIMAAVPSMHIPTQNDQFSFPDT